MRPNAIFKTSNVAKSDSRQEWSKKNLPLDPQQRLIHGLAEQIRFFLQEPD